MGEQFPGTPPSMRPPEDRLDSWKEIAAYLNRDVTTVQRWEKREGMPVHRHLHDRMGSVYAFRAELDAWTRSRNLRAAQDNENNAPSANRTCSSTGLGDIDLSSRWRFVLPLAAAGVALAIGAYLWVQRTEYFWRNPIAEARFQTVTDFDGAEQAAAVSRDGHFVAFLSDRDGQMDVWVTQVGSGQFHNLTRGSAKDIANPSVRTLGFSPDGSLVTFWVRKQGSASGSGIDVWAVPTLGGQPSPYLEGVAEYEWSHDGSRLAYHTPGPGDPLFVSSGNRRVEGPPIYTAPAGFTVTFRRGRPTRHLFTSCRAPSQTNWTSGASAPAGGVPERITSHNGRVTYPVLLDRRTLMYLASDPDGSGPWLYSMDVERRIPHRLTSGLDRYTSLAASADGRRLVVTLASPKKTLWRLRIADSPTEVSGPTRISLTTGTGFSPRLGPNYLLYVSSTSTSESIWKLATELERSCGVVKERRIFGGPAISPDGRYIAFSVRQHGQTLLYVMQADGTNARIVTDSLDLQGAPAWAPDGRSITSAADDHGVPHLFRVPVDGRSPTLFVQRVLGRSHVGTRWPLRCLLGTRYWHDVFGESRHGRGRSASPASADPDSGRSTLGLLTRRTGTRVPARRDSA